MHASVATGRVVVVRSSAHHFRCLETSHLLEHLLVHTLHLEVFETSDGVGGRVRTDVVSLPGAGLCIVVCPNCVERFGGHRQQASVNRCGYIFPSYALHNERSIT